MEWGLASRRPELSSHGKGLGHVFTFIPCLDNAGFIGKEMGLTPPGVRPPLPVLSWARLADPKEGMEQHPDFYSQEI